VARTVGASAEVTRARILDVALQLFAEQGYAGTSIRDIAERLGMTKSSLYYHFASKEDLLDALVGPLLVGLRQLAADASAAHPRAADEADVVTRLVDLFSEAGRFVSVFMSDPSVMKHVAQTYDLAGTFAALERALAGRDDALSLLRARCTLGVVHAGTIKTLHQEALTSRTAGEPPAGRKLEPDEKSVIVAAALAVLHSPRD
jgi:AcrR family transcriptional regulator